VGTLAFPATAHASSVNAKIANGYYSTVDVAHVPGGEALSFTLVGHTDLRALALTCTPDAAVSKLVRDSGYGVVFILPTVKQLILSNGNFNFSGVAAVSEMPKLTGKVTTAQFTVKGSYVPNGPSYHYTGSLQNKVTATLVFEGTATSSACTGLPANHIFRLYTTRSVG
jgi:hypothetical protein